MSDISGSPQSYLDFAGLGGLRGQAQQGSDKATRETATQFEAMFIQMMLKSMRDATDKSDLMGSETADQFEQMYDKELSVKLAQRNTMGVADMLVKHIDGNNAAEAAAKDAAKAENGATAIRQGLLLKPEAASISLPKGQDALPLLRPEKFNLKPKVVTAIKAGAD